MFIDELTIVSAYYCFSQDEDTFFSKRVNDFLLLRDKFKRLEMIVVDDGSPFPLENPNIEGIRIFRVKEDLGFNSHGCRNLGMSQINTEWGLLVDLDIDLMSLYPDITQMDSSRDIVHHFAHNAFSIHIEAFNSCRGYDEEFVNMHDGDRVFMEYLKKNFTYKRSNASTVFMRNKRMVVAIDIEKTNYDDLEYIFEPIERRKSYKFYERLAKDRYEKKDFSQKKTICFKWEEVF
jgi:hypothetical protein